MNAETESDEEEHNQLPSIEDVSEHRGAEEEEMSDDLDLEDLYFGIFTAYEGDYVKNCIAKDEAREHLQHLELTIMTKKLRCPGIQNVPNDNGRKQDMQTSFDLPRRSLYPNFSNISTIRKG